MCGIIAYIGDESALPLLIEGLRRMEYRGYDSAGVALLSEHELWVKKDVGRVDRGMVERGERVEQGQVLVHLVSGIEQAAYDLAKARTEFAERTNERGADAGARRAGTPQ